MYDKQKQSGFTIVELLIVIVVIAILATITIVAFRGIQDRARTTSIQSDLVQAAKQLELAKTDNDDNYPPSLGSSTKASAGTSFTYTSSGSTYCLTATNSGIAYHVTNTAKQPTLGSCSGTLADGSSCPSGYIVVPGNGSFGTGEFCVMKYEAKNVSSVATSEAGGSPWVSISRNTASSTAAAACSGCHLITEAEWMTIAANVISVGSNWSGGSTGSGYIYSGHNDNAPANSLSASTDDNDGYNGTGNTSGNQRRTLTLTNGEVIWDFAGNILEFTSAVISGGQPGLSGESVYANKQWNNGSLMMNSLPSLSQPSSISGAGSWSSTQGIGQLNSCTCDVTSRPFARGGYYGSSSGAGVLALSFLAIPLTTGTPSTGFRVSR